MSDTAPTWMDREDVGFWTQAFMTSAESYLESARAAFLPGAHWPTEQRALRLTGYVLLTCTGQLVRALKHAQRVFPELRPAVGSANHLFTEGKALRDMVEHADDYARGGGKNRAALYRERNGAVADATSTIVLGNGHWLGNRFCVERALGEVRNISAALEQIPYPDGGSAPLQDLVLQRSRGEPARIGEHRLGVAQSRFGRGRRHGLDRLS